MLVAKDHSKDRSVPEHIVPGITEVLYRFHDTIADLQRQMQSLDSTLADLG